MNKRIIVVSFVLIFFGAFGWFSLIRLNEISNGKNILGRETTVEPTTTIPPSRILETPVTSRTNSEPTPSPTPTTVPDATRTGISPTPQSSEAKNCPSYCHDGIYYSEGSYSSRSLSCEYVKTTCSFGCDSTGFVCVSKPSPPVIIISSQTSTDQTVSDAPVEKRVSSKPALPIPQEVAASVVRNNAYIEPKKTEIKEENGQTLFIVQGERKGKLFGIIPIVSDVTVKVNPQNKNDVTLNYGE